MDIERIKVRFLVFIHKVYYWSTSSCRMYARKPENPEPKCYLCAHRGGYFRCRRSRQLATAK